MLLVSSRQVKNKDRTIPMEDFSLLASSGLPSLGGALGSFENPTFNRSLRELNVASDSLWTSQKNTGNSTAFGGGVLADPSGSGSSLLGVRRVPELDRIGGSVESNSYQASQEPETDFLQWEEINRRREIDILKRIVQSAESTTRQRSQELFEKQLNDDWNKTRDLWRKELIGKRNLGQGQGVSATEQSTGFLAIENAGGHTSLLSSGLEQLPTNTNAMGVLVDPHAALYHLEIVKRIKLTNGKCSATNLLNAANEFGNFSPGNSPQSTCYTTALQIVSRILSRQNSSPLEVALATLAHFSGQFDSFMVGRVRKAGSDGQGPAPSSTMYMSSKANTVSSFVSLELGVTGEAALWPYLYYCLRIGDAVAALEIFEASTPTKESDETISAISSILASLAQRQGSSDSLWEVPGALRLPEQETRNIAEANEIAKAADHQADLHRSGVLSLLSGGGDLPTSGATAGFSTIEDWLFSLLWQAVNSPNPVVELENVGKTIRQFGSNYFADQDSGGWSYSLPLLASQQFHSALDFLVQAGGATGLMQATHLAMLLSGFDVDLENLGEPETHASGSLITSFLVRYSTLIHSDPSCGAFCALEYLLWIPNKRVMMMNEVVALILSSINVHELAGTLSFEGKRENGYLDKYFSATDVSVLLKSAAESRLRDAKDREQQAAAGVLFMLSGDFRSVVNLLSRLVSADIEVQNEEKTFWYQQAEIFNSTYLSQRCFVYDVLERNGDLDAVTTLRILMQIFSFFVFFSRGAYGDAWAILDDGLKILPKSQSDVPNKVVSYKELDPLVQQAIPSVLEASMKALYQQYGRLQRDMHSGDRNTAVSALAELKERAQNLISFAGMISHVPQAKIETMSRLEANMV